MRLTPRPRLAWIVAATTVSLTAGLSGPVPTAAASRTLSFGFTGSEQSFMVPAGVTRLQFRLVGAPGAEGGTMGEPLAGPGGRGAVVTGTLPVTPLTTVYVDVGGPGQGSSGGFNGGGGGGADRPFTPRGGGGGGSTDLRLCPAGTCPGGVGPSLASRLVIAGGGGGGGGAGYVCASQPGNGGAGGSGGAPPGAGANGTDGGRPQAVGRLPLRAPVDGGAGGRAASGPAGGSGGMSGIGQSTLLPGESGTPLGGGAGAAGDRSGSGGGGGGDWAGGGGGGAGGQVAASTGSVSSGGGGGGAGSSTAVSGSFTVGFDTTGVPGAQVAPLGAAPQVGGVDPGSGPATGGTTVTVAGSGFLGTTAVSFGGTPAAGFQVLSDTRLTALTPAHAAGAVDIAVTTPGGASLPASGARFTFVESAWLPDAPDTGSRAAVGPLASPPVRGFC